MIVWLQGALHENDQELGSDLDVVDLDEAETGQEQTQEHPSDGKDSITEDALPGTSRKLLELDDEQSGGVHLKLHDVAVYVRILWTPLTFPVFTYFPLPSSS